MLNNTITLEQIFIGDPDGLLEAKKDKFSSFFYTKNQKFEELVKDKNKFLITGRKGTGKTILAKYYEQQQSKKGILVKYIDKDAVLFNQLQTIGNGAIPQKERAIFAKYAILYEIGNILLNEKKNIIRGEKFIVKRRIKKQFVIIQKLLLKEVLNGYVLNEIGYTDDSCIEGNFSDKKKRLGLNFGLKQKEEKTYIKGNYYENINDLESSILEILKISAVSLIIDDLDEYDEHIIENSDFAKFLSKFIEVTYKLNILITEVSANSSIILLLRSDLLRALQNESTNLNKYIVNSRIILDWIKNSNIEQPENHILVEMILTKIRASVPDYKNIDNKKLYNLYFPDKIKGQDTLRFLLNFSHGRPRDIVNMLNMIIQKNKTETKFTNEMFLEVEAEYSRSFADELRNEMSLYYDSKYIEDCFHSINLIHKNNFWLQEAKDVITRAITRLSSIDDVEKMLEILYRFGVVGNTKQLNNQTKVSFGYREDGRDIVNFNEKFTVHFALRKSLV